MQGYTIDRLKIGDKGWLEKTITETDVYNYAGITGDFSLVHVNEARAKQGRFGRRVVHGMLLMGLISAVIGTQMPGTGTIYVSQVVKFLKPVFFNDTIRAEVEVIGIDAERERVRLKTTCTNQDGQLVLTGEAEVIPPTDEVLARLG
ncbi:MAG: MaoC family dehydratase [Firmicutes bacterium]|nr:MaoC family dehydratase [Bacillota bacterium]